MGHLFHVKKNPFHAEKNFFKESLIDLWCEYIHYHCNTTQQDFAEALKGIGSQALGDIKLEIMFELA
jgi:hypothetical protein